MRQIRQALRLHLEAGLSYAQVARAVGIGKGTVGKFMLLARAAGVDWGDVVDLGGDGGAAGAVDLAGAVVSGEDLWADALPGAGVLGFGHEGD